MRKAGIVITFALLFLEIVVLFLPLPHSGSIGGMLIHEFMDDISSIPERRREREASLATEAARKQAFYATLTDRFGGVLAFKTELSLDYWRKGHAGTTVAWLDTTTG